MNTTDTSDTTDTIIASVVVPTYKRLDLLIRCLTALIEQDIDPTTYEILIADDAVCDETRREVESWATRLSACGHTLCYIPVTGTHGPAAARNAGWRAASGKIIAFTDDDCLPTPGWLQAGIAAFTGDVVGVSGRLIVPLCHTPTDYERNAAQLATAQFVTANCFYRRECLEAIGGFDERFTAAWREDSDVIFTLTKRYCRNNAFVYAPDAVVIHPIRPAQWGVSLKQQRKSMFNALLYKKHPELYRQKIQSAPPWHYYGILGALFALLLGLLARKQSLSFVAACLWLLLTGRFCLHRLHGTSRTRRHIAEMLVTSLLIPPLAIFWRLRGAIKFRVFFL
jgi:glycosyltransferase involved in cell wall biosynthesis